MEFLYGHGFPPDCQVCGVSFSELSERFGDVKVILEWKDGLYQTLCEKCSDEYQRKRLDMYAGTRYGYLKKLKGAK